MDKKIWVENAEEGLKTFLPYFWNHIVSRVQNIFPIIVGYDKEERRLLESKIVNLPVYVALTSHPQPMAYTFPAISSTGGVQLMKLASLGGILNILYYFYLLFKHVKLRGLNATKGDDGKVIFRNPKDISMLYFISKGAKGMLEPEERIAVGLHEIGHWVHYGETTVSTLLGLMGAVSAGIFILMPLSVVFLLLAIYYLRLSEWRADEFVYRVGYGDQLSSALQKLSYGRRTNVSILGYVADLIRSIAFRLHDIIDKFLPISGHPSTEKRVKQLSDSLEYFDTYQRLLLESEAKIIYSVITKMLTPVDKMLVKTFDYVFPAWD